MRNFLYLLALAMLPISACSSLGAENSASLADSPMTEDPSTTDQGKVVFNKTTQSLGSLVNSQLPNKSCGMILWTLDAERPSPVFRYVAGDGADIVVGQNLVRLSRVNFQGDSDFGVFESQTFESKDGLRVEVTSRFGSGFDGGAYLERGLIKVFAPEGWSIVAPAAGIAGCRS
jgi:hypothetical protein